MEMSLERVQILWKLHNLNFWSEDLLNPQLFPEVNYLFTAREKELLGALVEQTPLNKICANFQINMKTLRNYQGIIKHIFRTGERPDSNLNNHLKQKIRRYNHEHKTE